MSDMNQDPESRRDGDPLDDELLHDVRHLDAGGDEISPDIDNDDDLQQPAQKRKLLPLVIAGVIALLMLGFGGMVLFGDNFRQAQEMPFGGPVNVPVQEQVSTPIDPPVPTPVLTQNEGHVMPPGEPLGPQSINDVSHEGDALGVLKVAPVPVVAPVTDPAMAERLTQLEARLVSLDEKQAALEKRFEVAAAQRKQTSTVAKTVRKPPEPIKESRDKARVEGYSLQAIIPGQAWVAIGGQTVVVHVGDDLPSGDKVRSIDPDKHEVVTAGGVIR